MRHCSFNFLTRDMQPVEFEATGSLKRAIGGLGHTVDEFAAAIEIYEEYIDRMHDRQSSTIHQRNAWQTKALVGARLGAICLYDFKHGADIIVSLLKRCPSVRSQIDKNSIDSAILLFSQMFPDAKDVRDSAAHIVDDNSTPERARRNRDNSGPLIIGCIDGTNKYTFSRRGKSPGIVNKIGYEVSTNSVHMLDDCLNRWLDVFRHLDPLEKAKAAARKRGIIV